jgi:outer membrane protein TolC
MPIFTAGTNSLKTKQAQLDYEGLKLNKQNTEQALALTALNAKNDVATAKAQLTSSVSQNSAAKSYFTLAEKAYAGGALTFIEYLDARTQLTNSEVGLNVAKFRVLQAYAALERETSQYALK